jgi:hypothetical protein
MESKIDIRLTETADGPLTLAGPKMPDLKFQLMVPSTLERAVAYSEDEPRVKLKLLFSGERFEVSELVARGGKSFVTTHFLTQLGLPRLIRRITTEAIPNCATWLPTQGEDGMGIESYDYLAQLYWFEHITWGSPRAAIMKYMGWSRANSNWHIRKIRKEFPLPTQTTETTPGNRPQN